MVRMYFILCIILCVTECLKVIPTKPEIMYQNPRFVKNVIINVKRRGRGSPYYVNMQGELIQAVGNNVTVSFDSYENSQGHYIPLLFSMKYELCKFYTEPIIGRMIVEQLPRNLSSCPVSPGFYAASNILAQLENFPLKLPFTYDAVEVRGKVIIKAFLTKTKEPLFNLEFHGRAIQRPRRN